MTIVSGMKTGVYDPGAGGESSAATGAVFDNGATLTAGRIGFGGSTNKVKGAAGFALIGTPSATAPDAGTNGPGTVNGVVEAGADGTSVGFTAVTFGNAVAQTPAFIGYACQGTAAAPGATIVADNALFVLRGHDGTNFTSSAASVDLIANSTWSPTNHESYIQFRVVANAATTAAAAGRVDPNKVLAWGGQNNGNQLFHAGTVVPSIQAIGTSANSSSVGLSRWVNNAAAAPALSIAKSRSATVNTAGVVTTGDTLGGIYFEADDGTNFQRSAAIIGSVTGTVAAARVPGQLVFQTGANAAGSALTTALTIDNAQLCTFAGGIALADAKNIAVGTSTGTLIGTGTTQKLGFYGVTPIAQRSGAAQAAVVTTGAALASYGYTQAQADSIVTLLNELRAWAVAQGFIKGSA